MADDLLGKAIAEHGNQLGENIVHLKRFLERLQNEQHDFLAEQRKITEKAQKSANTAAIFSAVAAVAAAVAAIVQAWDAFVTP